LCSAARKLPSCPSGKVVLKEFILELLEVPTHPPHFALKGHDVPSLLVDFVCILLGNRTGINTPPLKGRVGGVLRDKEEVKEGGGQNGPPHNLVVDKHCQVKYRGEGGVREDSLGERAREWSQQLKSGSMRAVVKRRERPGAGPL
jgi:hypothetical protein